MYNDTWDIDPEDFDACESCGAWLAFDDKWARCPVCGEPVVTDPPDALVAANLERCAVEYGGA